MRHRPRALGHLRVLDPARGGRGCRPAARRTAAARPLTRARTARAAGSAGQFTMAQARAFPAAMRPATSRTICSSGRRRGGVGVDDVDVVEAHAPERPVELLSGALLGPELPPELVAHDRVVAPPPRGAEDLTEEHLGVAGRDRRPSALVVVASVVEEVDAASRAARITSRPASREMRSNVRHDPSAKGDTSRPDAPRGRWGRALIGAFLSGPHRDECGVATELDDLHERAEGVARRAAERPPEDITTPIAVSSAAHAERHRARGRPPRHERDGDPCRRSPRRSSPSPARINAPAPSGPRRRQQQRLGEDRPASDGVADERRAQEVGVGERREHGEREQDGRTRAPALRRCRRASRAGSPGAARAGRGRRSRRPRRRARPPSSDQ